MRSRITAGAALFACFIVMAGWAGARRAGAQVLDVAAANPPSRVAFAEEVRTRTLDETLNVYLASSRRSPECDAHAPEVFEGYARRVAGHPDRPSFTEVTIATHQAIEAGCDDPMVVYVMGWVLDGQRHWAGADTHLLDAIARLEDAGYPSYIRAAAERRMADWLDVWSRKNEAPAWRERALDSLQRALDAGEFDDLNPRSVHQSFRAYIHESLPEEQVRRCVAMLIRWDGLDPWAREMLLGRYEVSRAFRIRGRGYAHTVPEDAWPAINRHMEFAAARYRAAYELDDSRPEAATAMIGVEIVTELEEEFGPDVWFEEAILAEFDWLEAYIAYINALRPRWGGSIAELWRLARECVEVDRFDTDVPWVYIQAVNQIAHDLEDPANVWSNAETYAAAVAVLDRLAKQPEHKRLASWYQTHKAGIALWADRDSDLLSVVDELGDRLDRSALWALDTKYDAVMERTRKLREPPY